MTRASTIHDEPPDAYRSADSGGWYVLNLIRSDMHGSYLPVIQSGPHPDYDSAWQQGALDNVRWSPSPLLGQEERRVLAARAFSVQKLSPEVARLMEAREAWLSEPMIVTIQDERGEPAQVTMERPYA